MLEKIDTRQFMKRKSISGSRIVENISGKRFRIEVQSCTDKWGRNGKAFCERPFALHRQQNFDVANPGNISADDHGCIDFDLILG